jgi:hypothetical protein
LSSNERNEVSLHRDRLHQLLQQRIACDRGKPGVSEQLVLAQSFWPGGGLTAKRLAQRWQESNECRANAGVLLQKLRHQDERASEIGGSLRQFALRLQHASEIVAGLGMIRLEQQHALVNAHGVVELAGALAPGRFRKQRVDLVATRLGTVRSCRRAMLERGAALFSVHRPSILRCL